MDGAKPQFERWASVSPLLREVSTLDDVMRGPRQRRIEMLEQASRSLPDDEEHEILSAFCGFIASRVADGSLEIWNAVLERSARFPTMPLWFAFYCGVSGSRSVLDFERSTPRRLLRLLDDVSYDVDAREFLVLLRGRGPVAADIATATPGTLRARLGPGVVASFLSREASPEERNREVHATDEGRRPAAEVPFDQRQIAALVAEARMTVERANLTLQRVQGLLPSPSPNTPRRGVQTDLELKDPVSPTSSRKGSRKRGKG
jgi:hypothetical protein